MYSKSQGSSARLDVVELHDARRVHRHTAKSSSGQSITPTLTLEQSRLDAISISSGLFLVILSVETTNATVCVVFEPMLEYVARKTGFYLSTIIESGF